MRDAVSGMRNKHPDFPPQCLCVKNPFLVFMLILWLSQKGMRLKTPPHNRIKSYVTAYRHLLAIYIDCSMIAVSCQFQIQATNSYLPESKSWCRQGASSIVIENYEL
jgi:hypothetical protein